MLHPRPEEVGFFFIHDKLWAPQQRASGRSSVAGATHRATDAVYQPRSSVSQPRVPPAAGRNGVDGVGTSAEAEHAWALGNPTKNIGAGAVLWEHASHGGSSAFEAALISRRSGEWAFNPYIQGILYLYVPRLLSCSSSYTSCIAGALGISCLAVLISECLHHCIGSGIRGATIRNIRNTGIQEGMRVGLLFFSPI